MRQPLRPLAPPDGPPPRLTEQPLPRYRHVPGLTPHPVTHPDGHSHGIVEAPISLEGIDLPRDWSSCEPYLEGIDLFNRGFFWEAHEAWETVWLAAGAETTVGRFLQGLIQAAAALLKRHVDMPTGSRNLLAKSIGNLEPALRSLDEVRREKFMGIRLRQWQRRLAEYLTDSGGPFPFLDPEV